MRALDAVASGADADAWIARSPAMRRLDAAIERIAPVDVAVSIQGETGVGKEVVARRIHALSSRRVGPFVKVHCAAIPDALLESELFGYAAGAFTGAGARRHGRFARADGGTIFLDEIGELGPALQAKLLHVLEAGVFTPLGEHRERRSDCRVVCATHRRLSEMVADGRFRADLYYRLDVVALQVPPLRERPEDLAELVELFARRAEERYRRPRPAFSPEQLRQLATQALPGNVRELENRVKRAVVLGRPEVLCEEAERDAGELSAALARFVAEQAARAGETPLPEVRSGARREVERWLLQRMLERTRGNRSAAARALGLSRVTLLQRIRELGLGPGPKPA